MTVQELYDVTRKKGDPREIELTLWPDDNSLAEVEFKEEDGEMFACLIAEGSVHL
jgi:hypothetical protein